MLHRKTLKKPQNIDISLTFLFLEDGKSTKAEFLATLSNLDPSLHEIEKCLFVEYDNDFDGELTIKDFERMLYLMDIEGTCSNNDGSSTCVH